MKKSYIKIVNFFRGSFYKVTKILLLICKNNIELILLVDIKSFLRTAIVLEIWEWRLFSYCEIN